MLKTGDKINKYVLIKRIGSGGEAQVWLARDTIIDKTIALKVIHDYHVQEEPEITQLFMREGRILSEINSPGIVSVLESNEASVGDKTYYYHAMEYVEAPDLKTYLTNNNLTTDECIRIYKAIVQAVLLLHELDDPVLHRDLKPENIFLLDIGDTETPASIKLFDFGLSRREFEKTITAPDAFRGTLKFSAPELTKVGGKASPASDIYALGIILRELMEKIAGETPPPWMKALCAIMTDNIIDNRPSARDVLDIIEEKTSSKSRISITSSRLTQFKNKVRARKIKRYIPLVIVLLLVNAVAFYIYKERPVPFFPLEPVSVTFSNLYPESRIKINNEIVEPDIYNRIALKPGKHKLEIKHDDYIKLYDELIIRRNQNINYPVNLQKMLNWGFDARRILGEQAPDGFFFKGHPLVCDYDNDGRLTIFAGAQCCGLFMIDGLTGEGRLIEIEGIDGKYQEAAGVIFDINKNGIGDLIYPVSECESHSGKAVIFSLLGPDFDTVYGVYDGIDAQFITSSLSIIDIASDGKPELVVADSEGYITLLDPTKKDFVRDSDDLPVWNSTKFCTGIMNCTPAFHDFNQDGYLDIVVGTLMYGEEDADNLPAGIVFISGKDGSELKSVDTGGSQIWGSPGLADLNGNNEPETVIVDDQGWIYVIEYEPFHVAKYQMRSDDNQSFISSSSSPAFFVNRDKGTDDIWFALANDLDEIRFFNYENGKIIKQDRWEMGKWGISTASGTYTDPLAVNLGDKTLFAGFNKNAFVFWGSREYQMFDYYSKLEVDRSWHSLLMSDINRDGIGNLLVSTVNNGIFASVKIEANESISRIRNETQITGIPEVLNFNGNDNKALILPTYQSDISFQILNCSKPIPQFIEFDRINTRYVMYINILDFNDDGSDDLFLSYRDGDIHIYSPEGNAIIGSYGISERTANYVDKLHNQAGESFFIIGSNSNLPSTMALPDSVPFLKLNLIQYSDNQIIENGYLDLNMRISSPPITYIDNGVNYMSFFGSDHNQSDIIRYFIKMPIDNLSEACSKSVITEIEPVSYNQINNAPKNRDNQFYQTGDDIYYVFTGTDQILRFLDVKTGQEITYPWADSQIIDASRVYVINHDDSLTADYLYINDENTTSLSILDLNDGSIIDSYDFRGNFIRSSPAEIGLYGEMLVILEMEIWGVDDQIDNNLGIKKMPMAQMLYFDEDYQKIRLHWSHIIPEKSGRLTVIDDFNNNGIYSLLISDAGRDIYMVDIAPLPYAETQFRGDRMMFDPEKWLNPGR